MWERVQRAVSVGLVLEHRPDAFYIGIPGEGCKTGQSHKVYNTFK